MKKLSYTTILAAACLLLPGCSDDAADKALVSPDVLVADSEVEIKLSSNSSTMATRAGVYGEGAFSTPTSCVLDGKEISNPPRLALFCLATGRQDGSEPTDIDWTRPWPDYNDVRLFNDPAKVWYGGITLDAIAYYPISNLYTYSFYGYYTKQAYASDVKRTAQQIDANVTINGYNDIIWGESTVPGEMDENVSKYAYSAKFYRECIKNDIETAPAQMTFKHMLTSFKFTVTPKDENAKGVTISSIKLKNQPRSATLCIASLENSDSAGKITKNDNASVGSLTLYDPSVEQTGDEHSTSGTLKETLVPATFEIGEETEIDIAVTLGGENDPAAFYVLPDQDKYTLEIVMTKNGDTFTSEMDIPAINVTAGTRTTVNLAIYGPQEISLQATLTPWTDVEAPEDIEL